MKTRLILLPIVLLILAVSCSVDKNVAEIKKKGFVPDEQTAIRVAEALWPSAFGDSLDKTKKIEVKLKGDIWVITEIHKTSAYQFGGDPTLEIRKSDCKVMHVYAPK